VAHTLSSQCCKTRREFWSTLTRPTVRIGPAASAFVIGACWEKLTWRVAGRGGLGGFGSLIGVAGYRPWYRATATGLGASGNATRCCVAGFERYCSSRGELGASQCKPFEVGTRSGSVEHVCVLCWWPSWVEESRVCLQSPTTHHVRGSLLIYIYYGCRP